MNTKLLALLKSICVASHATVEAYWPESSEFSTNGRQMPTQNYGIDAFRVQGNCMV